MQQVTNIAKRFSDNMLSSRIGRSIDNIFDTNKLDNLFSQKLAEKLNTEFLADSFSNSKSFIETRSILQTKIQETINFKAGPIDYKKNLVNDIFDSIDEATRRELITNLNSTDNVKNLISSKLDEYSSSNSNILSSGIYSGRNEQLYDNILKLGNLSSIKKSREVGLLDNVDEVKVSNKFDDWKERKYDDENLDSKTEDEIDRMIEDDDLLEDGSRGYRYFDDIIEEAENDGILSRIGDNIDDPMEILIRNEDKARSFFRKYGFKKVIFGGIVLLAGTILAIVLVKNEDETNNNYYIESITPYTNCKIKLSLISPIALCNDGILKINIDESRMKIIPSINGSYNNSDIIQIDETNIIITPSFKITEINTITGPIYGTVIQLNSLESQIKCLSSSTKFSYLYKYENFVEGKCIVDKNCILKNNFITPEGSCNTNNKKRYFVDISSNTVGNGLTCSQVAYQSGNGYSWSLDASKNRVYTDLECNNCGLPDNVTIGNCTNGTIQYTLGINPSPNDGDSCSSNLFPNNWSLSSNQLISLQDCSSDCILLPETSSSCTNGKITLFRNITSYPINDGESCVAVANKASPTYQWTLDTNNKRVYSETNCTDCVLSSVTTSICENGKVRKTVTVIQGPSQGGKPCDATALEVFGLSDTLSNRARLNYGNNNTIYIEDNCSNCDLSGLEFGPCTEIGKKQSAKIKINPTSNGISCTNIANTKFGNNNWQITGDEIFSYIDCSTNCVLKNNFITPEGDCNNNNKKYFMDISSDKIRNGLSCPTVAKSLNGYDWDIVNNRIYTNLECTNCYIPNTNVTIGDCTNGSLQYSLSINPSPNDGTSCSSNLFPNDWSLYNNQLVSLQDCSSNCILNNIITSDPCSNNKKRHYIGITSYESNNGLNCSTIANKNFPNNQWGLDTLNNRVYTDKDCSNCIIGTISTNNICSPDAKQRYTATITQLPNNGTSCQTVISENRFTQINNNWQISGNQVFTDVDCSVNCIFKNNFISSEGDCNNNNNNKKKYFIDISSKEIGAGLSCPTVASRSGNGYSWSLDATKNRLYTELDCVNCDVSKNVSIGDCTNGTIQYSLSINNSPNDGTSCSSNLFPNNWSLSGNQLISLKDCSSECILSNTTTSTGCTNGKNTIYRNITSYPINEGESCVALANKNSSYQWSLDTINRRVYTDLNCNDCILSDITSTLCVNGKVIRSVSILQNPTSGGKSCLEKALDVFSPYGITQQSQLKTDIPGKIYIEQFCSNCTFKNNFMIPEGDCNGNNKKYYMDVSSYQNLGTDCSTIAKSLNGYDWSLDLSKNRVYTNLECGNCDIPDSVSIGDCTKGTIKYSLSLNNSPNDGMSCINKAISNFGSSYNWSLSGNELVSLKDCSSNCSLKSTVYSDNNCVNNKKRYYIDISSYESNNGLNCSTIANENFSDNQWSLDTLNNRVYTDKDCSDCTIIGPTTNNICNSNGKQRYTATLTQLPNDGKLCSSILSENRFAQISNNWQISGNQVFTDVDCSANCILKNNFISSEGDCNNNNKKKYFIDISSKEIGTGLNCPTVASRSGNSYSWSLDNTKNRIYTDLDCTNCDVSNSVSIGSCNNGSIQYSLSINNSPNDGTSCSSNLFPNNWSLSGNQLVSLQDCSSNCSLKGNMYTLPNELCVNNSKRYYIDISSYESNNGLSCPIVANNRHKNQWSLDSVLNRVYTDLDCSNCILSDNIISSDCIDNKIRRSVNIIQSNNDGLGCDKVAISKFGNQYGEDGWVWDTNNNRVYKDQTCSNCDLSGLEVSNCINNEVTYSAIIKGTPNNGTDCREVAKIKFPGISNNWSISNGKVVATKSCSNCIFKNNFITPEGNCLGNKKKYFIDISSYQNLGTDCPTLAKSINGYNWSLDNTKNRIYTDLDCTNCDVSNSVSIGSCNNGSIQYSLSINNSPNDGTSCSSNLFPNNWSLSGNQLVSLQDCSSNCSLKGNMYTLPNELCINNSKRYYIDISSYGFNNQLSCTTIANNNFPNNQWTLDTLSNRVYTDINCSDCILSPVTTTICENGKVRKTVTILQDPTVDGISCENKALSSFGISDRSRLIYNSNNKTFYIEDNCSNCDLSGLEFGPCTEIGKKQSSKIKTNPTSNGISCTNTANTKFGNNNWQITGDEIFSYIDCSINCILKNNFMTPEGDCNNNKKKYFMDISSDKIRNGLSCPTVASQAGNGYSWTLDTTKNRIYTDLDCSDCIVSPDIVTIGNCTNDGTIQYSLSVIQSSNDGSSCTSNISNNVLETYRRDWSIDENRDRLFTQKSCDIDCVLKDNIINDTCINNDKRKLYIDISSYQIGNGLNCISKASEKHGNYQWSLDVNNKRLYSEVDCRDCVLSPITTSSCENGKVMHKANIIQETNGGLSCLEVARNRFGVQYGYENWDISSNTTDGRFVYKYEDCTNCELSDITISECIDGEKTYSAGIKNYDRVTNISSCVEVANSISPGNWKTDVINKKVIRTESCSIPTVNCELSDIVISDCVDGEKTYSAGIKNYDRVTNISSCVEVANIIYSGNWQIDSINKKIYKKEKCTSSIQSNKFLFLFLFLLLLLLLTYYIKKKLYCCF